MRSIRVRRLGILVGTMALLTLACERPVSDTGFRGRWQRNAGQAYVSIWEDAEGWHFCWSSESESALTYSCLEDGRTVMTENGENTYEYVTTMTLGPGEREATVEIDGRPLLDGLTPIHWSDRLELQPGGTQMSSWRAELNGRTLQRPRQMMSLTKIDDEPR